MADENGIASGGGMKAWQYAVIAGGAILILAVVLLLSHRREEAEVEPGRDTVAVVPEGSRVATLFFADKNAEGLVSETREVAIGREFTEEVERIISALLDGPEYAGVSTIPEGTKILNVFYDSNASILYLDFNARLVAGHPGGSSAEYYTIAAVMKTVSENFPEVKAVQFLVEGLQMDTIGGHIEATAPFPVQEWR
ncbi:MAG: GerMN domain-containing protein [Chitinivibrionia bacterium]|nr:GerMN domain-containing protein [Chitinivibrionia bacterium]